MTVPCEECLVLAICRTRLIIECQLLLNYMRSSNHNREVIVHLPIWKEVSSSCKDGKHRDFIYRINEEGDYALATFNGTLNYYSDAEIKENNSE